MHNNCVLKTSQKLWGWWLYGSFQNGIILYTPHMAKRKKKGLNYPEGSFPSSCHITEPTSCKQHKFHWFLLQSCHTSAGFYFMYYFWQNWIGNMRQRGKLGITFTTERCKKLDIISLFTGVKLMYFQTQWRKDQVVNSWPSKRGILPPSTGLSQHIWCSFPPVVFSFNSLWMEMSMVYICMFVSFCSTPVQLWAGWKNELILYDSMDTDNCIPVFFCYTVISWLTEHLL